MNAQQGIALVLLLCLMLPGGLSATTAGAASPAGLSVATPPVNAVVSLPAAASADWWATVQENIRRSEYDITWQDHTYLPNLAAAYQAPNRAQGLRTYFTPAGIRVIPRVLTPGGRGGGDEGWELGLAWEDGRAQDPPAVAANRIEYRREGIAAWYLNGEDGLLMGYVFGRPGSRDQGTRAKDQGLTTGDKETFILRPWSLSLVNLTPHLSADGSAVEFTTADGTLVLRYGDLSVADAAGRRLPAEVSLVPAGLDRYLLHITFIPAPGSLTLTARLTSPSGAGSAPEGLSTSPNWMAESNQNWADMGWSVGTAGDVNGDGYSDVVVGAFQYDNGTVDEGQAFVYHGSAAGLGNSPAWTADGGLYQAYFGDTVGTAGDVNGDGYGDVIVGAYNYSNNEAAEGAAFAYYGSAGGLSATADWMVESNQADANYGGAVGTAGDVNGDGYGDVVVGAPGTNFVSGKAYIYHGSAGGLSATESRLLSGTPGDWFGLAAGTAGDVNGDGYADVIVGANTYSNGESGEGAVYVYHGSASGIGASPDWQAEGNQAWAYLGGAVGTAGDVNGDGYSDVIVGAEGYDNGQSNEGRAYVYHGSASGLGSSPVWMAEIDQENAGLGREVGTAGDVNGDGYADIVLGSSYYRAYVYQGSAAGLSASADWTAYGGIDFGFSVGTAGDVNGDGYSDVIVGNPHYSNGQDDEGAAYVYHGSPGGLGPAASWSAESDQGAAYFGYAVGTAGDVNGDGFADVIVGAYCFDNGQGNEGRAYVYHGSATGLSTAANWTAEGDQDNAYFGFAVGTAGDVNGDGYADVIVGAHGYENGQLDEGRAYVYHGSAGGLSATAGWTAEGDQESALFGYSVGTAGDVNGDGYADVIVGALTYDNGETDEGRAFVYHGSAAGLSTTPNWTEENNSGGSEFSHAVGTAGDVNGDGYSDVIVGAELYTNGQDREGRAYVYHGSASGLSTSANWSVESDANTAYFGWAAGTAGDVDGDGYADVIVGAPYYSVAGGQNEGRAYLYYGSAGGLDVTAGWTATGSQLWESVGRSAGTAGDVNGDGYADVIVGASGYSNGQSGEGAARVYLGAGTGLSTTPAWLVEGDQANARFGYSAGTAGDVNGDGYADVVVGADRYDNGQSDEGRATVYYGNAAAGLSLVPRQRRASDSAPIAPLGMSDSGASFRLALLGRTPYGRGRVRLEWEVKPLGTLLDGSGTQQGASWVDTGTAGVQLSELAGSLGSSTVYHWRVRLRYRPAGTPFQQYSRWLTVPWNGWNEADLRTNGPTAVRLLTFAAAPSAGGVQLTWETAAEHNNLGFHLYRSASPDAVGERLNGALIPAAGSGGDQGASYTFLDTTAQAGVAYYYTLEDVDASGRRTAHGPAVTMLWRVFLPLLRR